MTNYDAKSCSALEKPYYRPIEAALRWCNLAAHEPEIIGAMSSGEQTPPRNRFPQWPCLYLNTEKIIDAIRHGELPGGREGVTVPDPSAVAKHRLTVRHNDLKKWIAEHFPDNKPKFLFDDVERTTHTAINADSFRALQADRDALEARINKAIEAYQELRQDRDKIEGERDSLAAMVQKMNVPGARAETTYLNIIGGLLGLLLGSTPAGKNSVYLNQDAIISGLLGHYQNASGISVSNLQAKFAEANRSIKQPDSIP